MVQNEINNLGFLTGEAKTKMSKVNVWTLHDELKPFFVQSELNTVLLTAAFAYRVRID